jgi:hypothetical protein
MDFRVSFNVRKGSHSVIYLARKHHGLLRISVLYDTKLELPLAMRMWGLRLPFSVVLLAIFEPDLQRRPVLYRCFGTSRLRLISVRALNGGRKDA